MADDSQNPFFSPSPLPYQLPPFADIRDEHYQPAFERGMEEQLTEVQAITSRDEPPTFDNTMLPLERSGQVLSRVSEFYFNKSSSDSTPFTKRLDEELAPVLAAHRDAVRLDPALYARIAALYESRSTLGLDEESVYLIERYYTEFTLAGAGLPEEDKAALREYNRQLSTLTTRFENNLLADTNDLAVVIDDVNELDGLSTGEISAAAAAAVPGPPTQP